MNTIRAVIQAIQDRGLDCPLGHNPGGLSQQELVQALEHFAPATPTPAPSPENRSALERTIARRQLLFDIIREAPDWMTLEAAAAHKAWPWKRTTAANDARDLEKAGLVQREVRGRGKNVRVRLRLTTLGRSATPEQVAQTTIKAWHGSDTVAIR